MKVGFRPGVSVAAGYRRDVVSLCRYPVHIAPPVSGLFVMEVTKR